MRRISPATALAVAAALSIAPIAARPARAQVSAPEPEPVLSHVLPVAAGALVGTAVTFFIMPLIVPAMASGVQTVGPAVAPPYIGAIGAAVGGVIGYTMFQ
jgi:hypothetical protein